MIADPHPSPVASSHPLVSVVFFLIIILVALWDVASRSGSCWSVTKFQAGDAACK